MTDGNGCTALSDGLHLTILPVDTTMLMLDACEDSFADYEGNQLLAGSEHSYTYANTEGCDSVVIVSVAEHPTYDMIIDLEACEDSDVEYLGAFYAAGSSTPLYLTSQYGCDSIVTINVATLPKYSTSLALETCSDETIEYNGNTLAPGDTYNITLTSSVGCDSTVEVSVSAFPTTSFATEVSDPVCFNASDGYVVVKDVVGGSGPYLYSVDGEIFSTADTLSQLAGGDYTIYVQDGNGCISETEARVEEIEPIQLLLDEVVLECSKDSVQINPMLANNYPEQVNWFWPDGGNDATYAVSDPGQFSLRLENQCEIKDKVIEVGLQLEGERDIIYVPNVFSPNGDGTNDEFTGFHAASVNIIQWELSIFDRWGTTMYKSTDIEKGWDGFFGSKRLNPGVYIWMYKAKVETCHREMELSKTGDVTILR